MASSFTDNSNLVIFAVNTKSRIIAYVHMVIMGAFSGGSLYFLIRYIMQMPQLEWKDPFVLIMGAVFLVASLYFRTAYRWQSKAKKITLTIDPVQKTLTYRNANHEVSFQPSNVTKITYGRGTMTSIYIHLDTNEELEISSLLFSNAKSQMDAISALTYFKGNTIGLPKPTQF